MKYSPSKKGTKRDNRALFKYLCSLLLFGSNGIVASHIPLSSYEIVFMRTMIGSILLSGIFLLCKGKFHLRENIRDSVFVCLSGIALGAGWIFLYEAYQQIGVGFASLLYYTGPMIVMITSPLIFKEKLTKTKAIGFAIVAIGVVLVNGKIAANGNTWGLFCGAMSAILFFFMIVLNKQAEKIIGMENSVVQLTVAFLTVAVFTGIRHSLIIHIPAEAWPWILFLSVVNTALGCYLYFSPLSKIPVQTVAVCGYLEPMSAVIFAALLLGERMTLLQVLGAVCILGGSMYSEFPISTPLKAAALDKFYSILYNLRKTPRWPA